MGYICDGSPNDGDCYGAGMKESVRTHVLVPREILEAVDRLVGQRRRSQFLAEAAQEKLERYG